MRERGHWTDAGLAHRSPVTPKFAFVRAKLTKRVQIAKVAGAQVTQRLPSNRGSGDTKNVKEAGAQVYKKIAKEARV